MKEKITQRNSNPFPFSDTNKRYYTYDYYLRKTYGEKCAKIVLDAGFTCPNIDGKCGYGGCIYCSGRGSGDFAQQPIMPIDKQYRLTTETLKKKWKTNKFIPYFQAHTNTYAPIEILRKKFESALELEGAVAMNIATRADCLSDEIVELLSEIASKIPLTIELGLQTTCDKTAEAINRGHNYAQFVDGFKRIRAYDRRINICIHIIFGLPEETDDIMLQTVSDVAYLHPELVKIHLLHVLKNTVLAQMYDNHLYAPLERERYVSLVCDAIELLPPDIVIERLTGDGMYEELLAPLWSLKKICVINDIDKMLYQRRTMQGSRYFEIKK